MSYHPLRRKDESHNNGVAHPCARVPPLLDALRVCGPGTCRERKLPAGVSARIPGEQLLAPFEDGWTWAPGMRSCSMMQVRPQAKGSGKISLLGGREFLARDDRSTSPEIIVFPVHIKSRRVSILTQRLMDAALNIPHASLPLKHVFSRVHKQIVWHKKRDCQLPETGQIGHRYQPHPKARYCPLAPRNPQLLTTPDATFSVLNTTRPTVSVFVGLVLGANRARTRGARGSKRGRLIQEARAVFQRLATIPWIPLDKARALIPPAPTGSV
ncbi:hypothetical protein B0H17DRAFT_6523 [Mycena rosella]|uniref:Uncharacterized protein n=1 Tax=Mycena rosella TaxID=1033263 RepID=A0AAD7MCR4_MYCRO|nr:hypothetical protein B0H17DRAFT_6523 [Mycena rosella]